jgi:hypothetical protein
MVDFSVGHFLMGWASNPPKNAEEIRFFISRLEEAVRKDERKRMSEFIGKLKVRMDLEFDAYVEYLDDSSSDAPEQIKLDL